jgi:hypothetical protein
MPPTDQLWPKMHHPKGSILSGRFILKKWVLAYTENRPPCPL